LAAASTIAKLALHATSPILAVGNRRNTASFAVGDVDQSAAVVRQDARDSLALSAPSEIESHAARNSLKSGAGESLAREVPLVNNRAVSDGPQVVVSVSMVGLTRGDKVR